MTNTRAQKIKNILNEIDKISHPPTKTISISEVEEEISKYKDGTIISINHQSNTTEAWESEDLSDFRRLTRITPDIIKAGKSAWFTRIIENLGISKSTLVTFTPTQTDLIIKIEDPIISILADFKKMCNNIQEEMLALIQLNIHPRTEERAIRDAASRMYTEWERGGGYREAISKVRGAKNKNKIKCSLIGDTLKELRVTADKTRHTPTINDIKGFVRKVQKLTPKDIKIEMSSARK